MTTTDPIAAYAAQTQANGKKSKSADELGINEFLTLMTAQLKNQDPLKPLDGTQFVAQLAQFGAVSGIQNMQGSMEALAGSLRSSQMLNGAALVGRDIIAPAEEFSFTQGGTLSGELDVPPGVSSLQIRITDETGNLVREMSITPREGVVNFTWDGLRGNGTPADSGRYEIEAIATAGNESGSLPVMLAGRVSSVTMNGQGGLSLNTPVLGAVDMNDVRRVM